MSEKPPGLMSGRALDIELTERAMSKEEKKMREDWSKFWLLRSLEALEPPKERSFFEKLSQSARAFVGCWRGADDEEEDDSDFD